MKSPERKGTSRTNSLLGFSGQRFFLLCSGSQDNMISNHSEGIFQRVLGGDDEANVDSGDEEDEDDENENDDETGNCSILTGRF